MYAESLRTFYSLDDLDFTGRHICLLHERFLGADEDAVFFFCLAVEKLQVLLYSPISCGFQVREDFIHGQWCRDSKIA